MTWCNKYNDFVDNLDEPECDKQCFLCNEMKEKIDKIEYNGEVVKDVYKMGHVIQYDIRILTIVDKINEIIDYLNNK